MSVILKTEKLRVEFNSREFRQVPKVALHGLDLEVSAGEIFGFLGPNGAGKTTTINVLLGFVQPTSGAAALFGIDVRQPIARQRIGYLPEMTYYYKFLSAEELLRFYAKIFGLSRSETDKRIENLLKLVELEHASKRQIKTYSREYSSASASRSSKKKPATLTPPSPEPADIQKHIDEINQKLSAQPASTNNPAR